MKLAPMEEALWHRRGQRPRPVVVLQALDVKVRVVDLIESDTRRLVLRDVHPRNLTNRAGSPWQRATT